MPAVPSAAFDLRLRTGYGVRHLLGLRHLAERVTGTASGVPNGRVVVRPGGAVADRDVAVLVLGDAAHPAPERVRRRVVGRVRALLVQRRRAALGQTHLVPPDSGAAVR